MCHMMKLWSKTCSFLTSRGHHTRNFSEDVKIDSDAKVCSAVMHHMNGMYNPFLINLPLLQNKYQPTISSAGRLGNGKKIKREGLVV